MNTVISARGAEGCEAHGGRRGTLHKEAERQLMKMAIPGEEESVWGRVLQPLNSP